MRKLINLRLERYLDAAALDLPTLPSIATDIVRVSSDPKMMGTDLVELIERDAGIASRILKVSNSALYGFPSRIQSLSQAVALLGFRAVKNLALSASMKNTYTRFGLMEKLLWEHSAMAGPISGLLASEFGFDVDDAFTAGLLHDIGKTALANSHRDEYQDVVARVYNERISFVDAERDYFGFDHAVLGAAVAERWQLPSTLVDLIGTHHDLEAADDLPEEQGRWVALVALATALLTRLGVGRRGPVPELDLTSHPAWQRLDLSKDHLEPLLERCRSKLETARSLLE